jgi:hypothetical protein
MTVKEIAAAVGKTDRNVRFWIQKVLDGKNFHVHGKNACVDMQNADVESIRLKAGSKDPHHPADYTPEETLLIIEAGLGRNAAGVFQANLGMAAELVQIREKLTDYAGFRADFQKFLENNSPKALPDPKSETYRELADFVENHLIITGNHRRDSVNFENLYDKYRAFVNHVLAEREFAYKMCLDNPGIEIKKAKNYREFTGCMNKY